MTLIDQLEAVARERAATTAGIAKAALWLDSQGYAPMACELLSDFDLTTEDLQKADAVERIAYRDRDLRDALLMLID